MQFSSKFGHSPPFPELAFKHPMLEQGNGGPARASMEVYYSINMEPSDEEASVFGLSHYQPACNSKPWSLL